MSGVFGDALRAHRERVHLTQEELAHRAGLGVRTIREFEAGRVRRPRSHSVRLLAQALALDEDARASFVALAYESGTSPGDGEPRHLVPRQLPADVVGFTGRSHVLEALDDVLSDDSSGQFAIRIAALVGMAGIGKTAVAVRWAHRVMARFADGQLFIDLHGYSSIAALRPIDALARSLRSLGVPAEQVPVDQEEAAALYRSAVAGRRMLLVLDNAASAEQVRPLLPGSASSFVLVTSRDRLTGLVAREGARELALSGLSADESRELLAAVLGADRVAADPCGTARLAALCAQLPLALRIAAANLAADRDIAISEYADRLASAPLTALQLPSDQAGAVLAAFDLSYDAQPAPARRMFRLAGLTPGPDFGVDVAAALASVTTSRASSLLDGLVAAHLVQRSAKGRFSLHDLLCRYARDRAHSDPDSDAATARLVDYYLAATDAAAERLYPYMFRMDVGEDVRALHHGYTDDAAALAWLDTEHHNVIAAIELARRARPRTACALAVALRCHLYYRGDTLAAVQTADAALAAAANDGGIDAQTAAEITAAMAYYNAGEHARATGHGVAAVRLARQAGIRRAVPPALANLAPILLRAGEPGAAAESALEALVLARECGQRKGEAPLLVSLTLAYRELGRLRDAEESAREAVATAGECESPADESLALARLGEVCHLIGELDHAVTHLDHSLAIASAGGHRATEASALALRAAVASDQGRLGDATSDAQAALLVLGGLDHWTEIECRAALGSVMRHLGRDRDAAEQHTQTLDLVGTVDRCAPAVLALIGLSEAHRSFGEMQEAAACAREALQISRAAGYRVLEGQAHVAAARAALDEGRHDVARKHAMSGIALQHETGHRLGEARAKVVLGHAGARTRVSDWQDAVVIFRRCGALAEAAATEELIRSAGDVANR
jgi:tetratricopeptide (TPR) repeat protein/transcriptional regulator with XRE-family HTH domain